MPEDVRLAMARDMVHHRKAPFKELLARVQTGLKEIFGTSQPVLPLSCSGTGAMVAAVGNLFAPGERVLVVEAGKFGERWVEISEQRGLRVETLSFPWGQGADVAVVAEKLAGGDFAGLLIQVSETSTGVLHPVREIAALTRASKTLLVCDGISAVSVSPCPMDAWGIDCLLTGSQKGLMLPPGLALAALSDRAWAKADSVAPATYYFDLKAERDACLKNQTRFTSPVGLLVGLDVALEHILTFGLENLYRQQWAMTRMARAGMAAMGLPLLAESDYTWGLTATLLPQGLSGPGLLKAMAEEFGVVMAGGQGHQKDTVVRLGHMGHVDFGDVLAGLAALAQVARAQGFVPAQVDFLEQAMAAYMAGLTETRPLP